jgi:3-hydroxyacyl-CoA dehydrogenase/enoyl-CoA hydratase/3-hydroxybutyryl-CoA epimerase
MKAETNILTHLEADRLELGRGAIIQSATPQRHWQRRREEDDIEWLILDQPGIGANRIDGDMLEELDRHLSDIRADKPRGLVIRSAKKNGFLAGADINQFRGLGDDTQTSEHLERAHQIVDRLAALDFPTIAVIHGFCLGGGLELALACRYRIAITGASLGFPEVQLGLHPGLGGTARLTWLIDPIDAMTMMLTGKNKYDRAAKRAGLVDAVTEERHVANAVRAFIAKPPRRRVSLKTHLLRFAFLRRLVAGQMRKATRKRARPEHYPAPFALIDLFEIYGGDFLVMKRQEIVSFADLLVSETAQNLIRLFFLREKLREKRGKPAEISHVHVVGAGAMGGDIAAWCALQKLTVTLADLSLKMLGNAVQRAYALYEQRTHSSVERRAARDRLIADPKGAGAARADLIIEAVPENLELKRKIFAGLEAKATERAILATNTSSIRLEDISSALEQPDRLVGLHFFNPVARMLLVEVVKYAQSSAEMVEAARHFAIAIDRLPVVIKSAPGFLVNRTLMPYLAEALTLMNEGHAPEVIDAAAEEFGMPMGPIELADEVGLDICMDVAKVLSETLTHPFPPIPDWLENKVKKGEKGKKSGKGIYPYRNGRAQKKPLVKKPEAELADRLILPLVNMCATCLREGVVADEEETDAALVFGTGFAPFRGGPMHYSRRRGFAEIHAALSALETRHGARFAPDPYWQTAAS